MRTLKHRWCEPVNPPVWSVTFTKQQLYALRAALRERHASLHGEDATRPLVYDALQRVHLVLLDAGGADDTE